MVADKHGCSAVSAFICAHLRLNIFGFAPSTTKSAVVRDELEELLARGGE